MLNLDFSLETTGFDMAELDLRIESLAPTHDPDPDPTDRLPAQSGPSISRLGDHWLLGRQGIYCGSALDISSYLTLMDREKAAMLVADPPFNSRIEGNVSGLGKTHHRESRWPQAR